MMAEDLYKSSDFSKLAGQMSAMSGYMNAAAIPEIKPIHKRVQLLALMYEQSQLENKRLTLLLGAKELLCQGQ